MISSILGYIDLSKRRVSTEDISKCDEKFARGKIVRYFLYRILMKTWVFFKGE
jgi:translation initiation factor 2 alpha subunit (eIF-2alpha)